MRLPGTFPPALRRVLDVLVPPPEGHVDPTLWGADAVEEAAPWPSSSSDGGSSADSASAASGDDPVHGIVIRNLMMSHAITTGCGCEHPPFLKTPEGLMRQ